MSDETRDPKLTEIDSSKLDEECVRHSKRYHKLALELADRRADLDESKALMELTEARTAAKIRDDPEKYGFGGKLTEEGVKIRVRTDNDVIETIANYHEAKKRVAIADAAVSALDHRKKMLELAVQLHGQDYFSVPRISNSNSADGGVARDRAVVNSTLAKRK